MPKKIEEALATRKESDEPVKLELSAEQPLSEFADVWYELYKTKVRSSTYSGYAYTLDIIKTYFNDEFLFNTLFNTKYFGFS